MLTRLRNTDHNISITLFMRIMNCMMIILYNGSLYLSLKPSLKPWFESKVLSEQLKTGNMIFF